MTLTVIPVISNLYTYIDVYIQKVIPLNLLDMLDCLYISQVKQISVFRKHIPPARGFRGDTTRIFTRL